MRKQSRLISMTGILAAMSTILYVYPTFPIIPAFPWLKIDFADIPALFAAVLVNPFLGGVVVLIRNTVHLLMSSTGMVGELSNFIISVSYVMFAGLLSRLLSRKNAISTGKLFTTMLCAVVIQVIVAALCNNYIMIPLYGIQGDSKEYLMMGVIPFNLIKTVMSSTVFTLIYISLVPKIRRFI